MRPGRAARFLSLALGVSLVSGSLLAATIMVTNTNDSGAGSFRDAIDVSNASVGVLDTIAFNIAGTGVHTIAVATGLPNFTDPVVVDGTTQPGYAGSPLIEIKADGPLSGLRITAGGSTIRALVVNSFTSQISLTTNGGNLIESCYIGTDPTGTVAMGSGPGVFVQNSAGNTIGGTSASSRNLISGNPGGGIYLVTANATEIQGNFIGTDVTGAAAISNDTGVTVANSADVTVGGTVTGAGNLISGQSGNGVYVQGSSNTLIAGNLIGTDAAGTQALPNNFGINADNLTGSITIGGTTPEARNVVSGNNNYGLFLNNGVQGAVVQGNFIGTDVTGTLPLPNNYSIGLNTLDTTDVLIGGTGSGEGNVIAFNRGFPVLSFPGGIWNLGLHVTIRGNSIHDNFGLGIDNSDGNYGVDPNDPGDPDTGANEFQNFPIVSSVTVMGPEGINTRIQGVLHSTPSTIFTLDFYSNPACARFPREFLEGETYLGFGQTTTDGAGTGVFDVTLPGAVEPGARISATATDPSGNTSEFSQRIVFSILPTSGPPAGGTAVTLSGTDFASGASVTIGGAAASSVNVSSFTQISATTPALAPGTVSDVTVTNTDGSAGTLSKGWVSDFLDVPPSQQFYAFVTTLVSNAITVGVGGGLYGVTQDTLRRQMAVFLMKAKHGLCYTPPPCITPVFTDVPCSSSFAPWINELVLEGITGGCSVSPPLYCPANPVLRQQMAVLLLRTLEGAAYAPPACVTATFGDVPCSSPFATWVYELVARSITAGCGGGNYCPTLSANRGQMATFIVKTFGLQ